MDAGKAEPSHFSKAESETEEEYKGKINQFFSDDSKKSHPVSFYF
jgi:hypothetical protein